MAKVFCNYCRKCKRTNPEYTCETKYLVEAVPDNWFEPAHEVWGYKTEWCKDKNRHNNCHDFEEDDRCK